MTDEQKEPVEIVRRTVRVKPHRYQPGKVEMEEVIDVGNPDGSRPTPEDAVRALLQPVEIVEDSDA